VHRAGELEGVDGSWRECNVSTTQSKEQPTPDVPTTPSTPASWATILTSFSLRLQHAT
jgi:hypothetical protein